MSLLCEYSEAVRAQWERLDDRGDEPPWGFVNLTFQANMPRYHQHPNILQQARFLVSNLFGT
jgi:hypothetical protein